MVGLTKSRIAPALLLDNLTTTTTTTITSGPATTSTITTTTVSDGAGSVTKVIVHPLVLFHILDHHTRRQEAEGRVIGTLLGRRGCSGDEGTGGITVEITNSFAVPHAERGEEVAIGKDFNKRMLALHHRASSVSAMSASSSTLLSPSSLGATATSSTLPYRRETVVGWYASAATGSSSIGNNNQSMTESDATPPPPLIADTTSLIHEFYASETEDGADPIHLVLDTRLLLSSQQPDHNELYIRAYKSTPVVVQGETVGSLFHELPLQLKANEPETICLQEMVYQSNQQYYNKKNSNKKYHRNNNINNNTSKEVPLSLSSSSDLFSSTSSPLVSSTDALEHSMYKLYHLLSDISQYVDSIVDGHDEKSNQDGSTPNATELNPEVGRQLYHVLASIPRIRPPVMDRLFQDSLQDLLMVTYLAKITQTQIVIAEKLNATLGMGLPPAASSSHPNNQQNQHHHNHHHNHHHHNNNNNNTQYHNNYD